MDHVRGQIPDWCWPDWVKSDSTLLAGYHALGFLHLELGRLFERARYHFEEIDRNAPDDWDYWGTSHRTSYAYVLSKLGEHERARALLDTTLSHAMRLIDEGDERPGVTREIAAMHAAKGNRETAYEWLARAIEAGWRHEALQPSPFFEPLRADPRFNVLMQQMHADIERAKRRVRREKLGPPLPSG